jgi:peptidoglycan/LPS O-acetylase OafA/YrhL
MKVQSIYVKELDSLRGIAVILVMLVHFGVLGIGWVGVQLFFVLSGYLITKGLLIEKQEKRIINYLKIFYWKRSLRIFPTYFVYIFLFVIICIYFDQWDRINKSFIPLITYTINIYAMLSEHVDLNGIGHLWSLAVEEQFYLVWPFIIFFIPLHFLKNCMLSIIIFIPLFRYLLFTLINIKTNNSHYAGEMVYMNVFSHFDAFASGALILFFEDKYKKLQLKLSRNLILCMSILLTIVGVLNLFVFFIKDGFSLGELSTGGFPHLLVRNYAYIWGYTFLNLFFSGVIFCIIKQPNVLYFLQSKILIYFGKISYGIYLYHVPVLIFTRYLKSINLITNIFLMFGVYVILTVFIANCSFQTIESYFKRFKKVYT